jgi:hypothetical protein
MEFYRSSVFNSLKRGDYQRLRYVNQRYKGGSNHWVETPLKREYGAGIRERVVETGVAW